MAGTSIVKFWTNESRVSPWIWTNESGLLCLTLSHQDVMHQVQGVGVVNVAGGSHELVALLSRARGGGWTDGARHRGGGGSWRAEVVTTLNVSTRLRTFQSNLSDVNKV